MLLHQLPDDMIRHILYMVAPMKCGVLESLRLTCHIFDNIIKMPIPYIEQINEYTRLTVRSISYINKFAKYIAKNNCDKLTHEAPWYLCNDDRESLYAWIAKYSAMYNNIKLLDNYRQYTNIVDLIKYAAKGNNIGLLCDLYTEFKKTYMHHGKVYKYIIKYVGVGLDDIVTSLEMPQIKTAYYRARYNKIPQVTYIDNIAYIYDILLGYIRSGRTGLMNGITINIYRDLIRDELINASNSNIVESLIYVHNRHGDRKLFKHAFSMYRVALQSGSTRCIDWIYNRYEDRICSIYHGMGCEGYSKIQKIISSGHVESLLHIITKLHINIIGYKYVFGIDRPSTGIPSNCINVKKMKHDMFEFLIKLEIKIPSYILRYKGYFDLIKP
jgi:hypothetical protein